MLRPGDEPLLEPLFAAYPDTTLFFQSNLAAAGLVDRGEPMQGTYAAAFGAGGRVVALACHCWNGNLLLEAPEALADVAHAALAATAGRPLTGLVGVCDQALAARRLLGLDAARTMLDSREDLFALALDALRVPAPLRDARLACRTPREDELDLLVDWRHDYRVEAIGEPAGETLRAKSRDELTLYQRTGRHFVLEDGGHPVAYAAFNAQTPRCVQIGGVWTPPALRGRGYGRTVVAGALLHARARGVARSVLFTPTHNAAAQTAYRALGYQRVGDYALLLFAEPQPGSPAEGA